MFMHTHPAPTSSASYPVSKSLIQPNLVLQSGIFGTVIGATAALGANLHRVRQEELSLNEAMVDSLAKGAGTGVAAAVATAAVQSVGGSRVTSWVVLLAAATGVGYAINLSGKKKAAATK
jgi:NADPH:quinone reductase-like Zn-dependent oxidoreductase